MRAVYIITFVVFIATHLKGQSDSALQKPISAPLSKSIFVNAEFPGGDTALLQFLQQNIRYPESERNKSVEGKVLLRFLVDEQGFLADIKVIKSVSPELDAEAIRVVKLLPKFKPGLYQGAPAKVYFNLPITFKLTDSKSKDDKLFAEKLNKDEFFKRAIELREKGMYKEAVKQIKKSISRFPEDYLGYEFLGVCHVQLGKNAEACNDFSRAKELGSPKAAGILKEHCQ